jgi:hypothetical protein
MEAFWTFPHAGGQNFDQPCCLLAVNASLKGLNDTIVVDGNLSVSANVLRKSQFHAEQNTLTIKRAHQ